MTHSRQDENESIQRQTGSAYSEHLSQAGLGSTHSNSTNDLMPQNEQSQTDLTANVAPLPEPPAPRVKHYPQPGTERSNLQSKLDDLKQSPNAPFVQQNASKAVKQFNIGPDNTGQIGAAAHKALTTAGNSVAVYGLRNEMGLVIDTAANAAAGGPGNLIAAGAAGVAKTALGTAAGVAGQTFHQEVTTPWLNNTFKHQYEPVPPKALMTDKKKELLNNILPGYGDKLQKENQEIADKAFLNSTHSDFSSKAFAAGATVSTLAQAALPADDILTKGAVIAATSAAAGTTVGARQAYGIATTAVEVPKKEELGRLKTWGEAAGNVVTEEHMKALKTSKKNVAYPRLMSDEDKNAKNAKAASVLPNTSDGRVENAGTKFTQLSKALAPANIIQTAGAMAATQIEDPVAKLAVSAIANGGGIAAAIPHVPAAVAIIAKDAKEVRMRSDNQDSLNNWEAQPLINAENDSPV